MDKGTEIQGVFNFNGIVFNAGYRSGYPKYHQGGYAKCLRIYEGYLNGDKINGHEYFGDDKFGVNSVEKDANKLILTMDYGIYQTAHILNPMKVVELNIL